jgi:hypothetical protein
MVDVAGAMAIAAEYSLEFMLDTATFHREDGSTFTERYKIERVLAVRSNDEQQGINDSSRFGFLFAPKDSEVRRGLRVHTAYDIWYITDDNRDETIRGTVKCQLYRQDAVSEDHVVTLYAVGSDGTTTELGPFNVKAAYAALLPTIRETESARMRRVDVTLIGGQDFNVVRPGYGFAMEGLSGVVLDVNHPQVDRVEAICQVIRGVPG